MVSIQFDTLNCLETLAPIIQSAFSQNGGRRILLPALNNSFSLNETPKMDERCNSLKYIFSHGSHVHFCVSYKSWCGRFQNFRTLK